MVKRLSGHSSGFTYIGLLITLAIISVTAAATVQVGGIMQRRQAEEELLFVGLQFKKAINRYFDNSPPGPATSPRKLEDLLKDPRHPETRRYLRKIYTDPLTGKAEWGLIRGNDGGILGVYSLSKAKPIRMDNFPDEAFYFKGKKSFRDWVFVYGVVCTDNGCELPAREEPGGQPVKDEDDKP